MLFVSTRASSPRVSFDDAVRRGIAPDGGLYVPQTIPAIGEEWRGEERFSDLAAGVLTCWLGSGETGRDHVRTIVESALDFPVPVVRLSGGEWEDVMVVELFHGPTLSFKDFGARCMAGFLSHAMTDTERKTILVATSGDTGSAVADGFSGFDGIEVVLLYPLGKVSPTQERQLVVKRSGVRTFAVDGTFDDCQRMVKEAFARDGDRGVLTSANSINVGRLLPQMTYYFWAARQFERNEFLCCVPSGNLGNLTAGVMAHLSGMGRVCFVAAHNANDFFPRFLETGESHYTSSVRTLSNAMDVGVPSNFERLRYLLEHEEMRNSIRATSVSDDETLDAMRRVYESTGYVADPHTAVGFEAVARYRRDSGDDRPIAIMATAHPAKFPEAVHAALGISPAVPDRLAACWKRDTQSTLIAPDADELLDRL